MLGDPRAGHDPADGSRAAGELVLEMTTPVAQAQLAETVLLNHLTFQTSVAAKAARCLLAAGGAQVVDFAFPADPGHRGRAGGSPRLLVPDGAGRVAFGAEVPSARA